MSKYKGVLHETAETIEGTDIWCDSCGLEELNYTLERGAVGATTNPIIVGKVLKKELADWEDRIREIIKENPTYSEDDIAWELIENMGHERAKLLLPVYEKYKGKKGRLSIQTNIKFYRDPERILAQALHFDTLGDNMQVKIPASKAGLKAFEEATYQGVSINATVSFTVAQAVQVAEAVERGLDRRKQEGLPTDHMSPVCTIMMGRTDDWLKEVLKYDNIVVDPEALEWAGVAVMKHAYEIYQKRGYTTRLLTAAYRNHYHWSQLVGADMAMTIPLHWHKKLNGSDLPVERKIEDPVPSKYMDQLLPLAEFKKAYLEDGMAPEEFERFGAFRKTLHGFKAGYDDLIYLIRDYLVTDPLTDR